MLPLASSGSPGSDCEPEQDAHISNATSNNSIRGVRGIMQRDRQPSRQTSLSHQHHQLPLTNSAKRSFSACLKGRQGRALTEVILIVLVPCFCLFCWALLDSEMRKSLLAAPSSDPETAINPVFAFVKAEPETVVSVYSQGQLRFWDLTNSAALGDMQSELTELRCGAYSPKQRLLAVGSAMGKLEVRDLDHPETPVTSRVSDLQEVAACQFTPDGNLLISAGEGRLICFWEPRTLNRVHAAELGNEGDSVRSLVMSDDGQFFLAGTHNGQVQVWDVNERKMIRKFRVTQAWMRPEASVEAVALLPGDKEFVAATRKDGVAVWDAETGKCIRKFNQPLVDIRSGVLSEDGSHFIAGNDQGQMAVWNVATGQLIKLVQQRPVIVRSVACDEHGSMVMTGNWSGHIQWHSH